MGRSSQLSVALRERMLVNFRRPFEQGSVNGVVLDIGPRFFLLALIDDGCRCNGFQCFRLSDVRGLEAPHKYAEFVVEALKKRGQRIPSKPRVNMDSIEALLTSASRAFPLVTLHREVVDPDVCHIGRVEEVGKGRISILGIGPDAKWDDKPTEYRVRDITRVDFGGDYEDALNLVGGAPSNTTLQPTSRARVRSKLPRTARAARG
jgi:hypothetical protein